ncbi:helix-turn-helix transcriptional regulator [Streptosporangium sp. NPDC005286]|uniref:helix-turn-helix domain-containing protein n=1 Tax=Streptosporangium sp. NPDC005286 TaxID=3154463 RepID=UPI0033B4D41F
MGAQRSPSVRRRRLAAELQRLRKEAGLTRDQAAEHAGCSPVTITRIESATSAATVALVAMMLDLYGVTGERQEALMQLARDARKRGWWYKVSEAIPEWVQSYVGLEEEAATFREYQSEFVPGLLQTEGYARAVMRSAPVLPPDEEMERRLSIRMKRQERALERPDPPMMWCILNEAVIRRPVGGVQSMQDQLQRLIQLSERSYITLQVLPFSAGVHPAMDGGFTVLSFPKMSDPDTVYVEYWQGSVYLEDPREVDAYVLLFDHLRARALGPDQTRSLIEQAIREMRVDGEACP